jgi:hypothetical protein
MSRGKWSAATKAKSHHKTVAGVERDRERTGGIHIIGVAPWVDRRVRARRKARATNEALLTSVLYAVASANRKHALEIKAVRYVGSKCSKHPDANGERYSKTGHCIICSRETRRAARQQATVARQSRPPHGTWTSAEQPDTVRTADYRRCTVCGKAIPDTRIRSATCSATCCRAAYRHSNVVNRS